MVNLNQTGEAAGVTAALAVSQAKPVFGVEDYPTIEALETFRWPQADWFDYSTLRPQLEAWADDYAIACTGCSVFQHPSLFRGIEQLLYELVAEPETAALILDNVTAFYLDYFGRIFAAAGDLIDIFRLADDIGAQQTERNFFEFNRDVGVCKHRDSIAVACQ